MKRSLYSGPKTTEINTALEEVLDSVEKVVVKSYETPASYPSTGVRGTIYFLPGYSLTLDIGRPIPLNHQYIVAEGNEKDISEIEKLLFWETSRVKEIYTGPMQKDIDGYLRKQFDAKKRELFVHLPPLPHCKVDYALTAYNLPQHDVSLEIISYVSSNTCTIHALGKEKDLRAVETILLPEIKK